mmetsp:Transcript_66521/g.128735  ORF Transcript_66521/g.128735 Transcript_66521/m.128735 type:complete len:178 (+) Transcript_66521:339-872(+)
MGQGVRSTSFLRSACRRLTRCVSVFWTRNLMTMATDSEEAIVRMSPLEMVATLISHVSLRRPCHGHVHELSVVSSLCMHAECLLALQTCQAYTYGKATNKGILGSSLSCSNCCSVVPANVGRRVPQSRGTTSIPWLLPHARRKCQTKAVPHMPVPACTVKPTLTCKLSLDLCYTMIV